MTTRRYGDDEVREGDATAVNGFAGAMGAMSLLMGAVVAASGKPDKALVIFGMFGGMALAALGANLIRLPRWARERERQMEAVAERAVKLLTPSGLPDGEKPNAGIG